MTNGIEVSALRGDDYLGFLAALGVVSLAEHKLIQPVRLAWELQGHTPVAVFYPESSSSGFSGLADLQKQVYDAFKSIHNKAELIPGTPTDPNTGQPDKFPLPVPGKTKPEWQKYYDPMRMPATYAAAWYAKAAEAWKNESSQLPRWLLALLSQVSTEQDGSTVMLTPFYTRLAKLSMRGSMFENTIQAVQEVGGPKDAFDRWKRLTDYYGANLDGRAKRGSAYTTDGNTANAGAPSPTWLAMMALPFFPIADGRADLEAVGWQRVKLYPGYTNRSLIWPVWKEPATGAGIRALLSRPELKVTVDKEGRHHLAFPERLQALSVIMVFGASRSAVKNGDGPFGRVVQLHPVPARAVG